MGASVEKTVMVNTTVRACGRVRGRESMHWHGTRIMVIIIIIIIITGIVTGTSRSEWGEGEIGFGCWAV